MALRHWINAHCTETEGRDNLCLWEKVRTYTVTQKNCGANMFNLFITLHPLFKWKQGTSFEEEGTHTEFKHVGYKRLLINSTKRVRKIHQWGGTLCSISQINTFGIIQKVVCSSMFISVSCKSAKMPVFSLICFPMHCCKGPCQNRRKAHQCTFMLALGSKE